MQFPISEDYLEQEKGLFFYRGAEGREHAVPSGKRKKGYVAPGSSQIRQELSIRVAPTCFENKTVDKICLQIQGLL